MTAVPSPAIDPETLAKAIDAGARAYAKGYGLDLDDLAASKDPGDTDADLAAWRANLIETAREVVEAAVPVLLAEHEKRVVKRIASALEALGSPLCTGSCEDPDNPPTVNGNRLAHHCDCSAVQAAALLLGSFKLTDHFKGCGTGEWWDEIYADEIAATTEFLARGSRLADSGEAKPVCSKCGTAGCLEDKHRSERISW